MDQKPNEDLAGTATLNHDINPASKAVAEAAVQKLKDVMSGGLRLDTRHTAAAQEWQALQDICAAAITAFAQGGTAVLVARVPTGTNQKRPGYITIGFGERNAADAASLLRSAAAALSPTGMPESAEPAP